MKKLESQLESFRLQPRGQQNQESEEKLKEKYEELRKQNEDLKRELEICKQNLEELSNQPSCFSCFTTRKKVTPYDVK